MTDQKSFKMELKELYLIIKWGCSSAGRAPALQAGGQGFDSLHLHQGWDKMNEIHRETYMGS